MKIIVIGSTGTIGSEVANALSASTHEVVHASRSGDVKVDLDNPASIRSLFEKVRDINAVVSCAGNAVFKPFADLADADYELGLRSKLMGQVTLARLAKDHLREGGSITLTTGVLAMHPMVGSASISMVNAGLEGFVRAAALEMPRKVRINAVSPPWVKETMVKFGMDPTPGLASATVAKAYVAAVEGSDQGKVIQPQGVARCCRPTRTIDAVAIDLPLRRDPPRRSQLAVVLFTDCARCKLWVPEAQASASSSLSSPQNISLPTTNEGEPKMPKSRAASVSLLYLSTISGLSARAMIIAPSM